MRAKDLSDIFLAMIARLPIDGVIARDYSPFSRKNGVVSRKNGLVRARMEPFRARVEPFRARVEPFRARIESFRARMEPFRARIESFRARMAGASARAGPGLVPAATFLEARALRRRRPSLASGSPRRRPLARAVRAGHVPVARLNRSPLGREGGLAHGTYAHIAAVANICVPENAGTF